ncbi:MAG TPA: hypothetical protein VK468_03265 [Pyrinomonadaceae bacterium]|nr:hypothetical protein [Pyrinomonadaceae bacterium]
MDFRGIGFLLGFLISVVMDFVLSIMLLVGCFVQKRKNTGDVFAQQPYKFMRPALLMILINIAGIALSFMFVGSFPYRLKKFMDPVMLFGWPAINLIVVYVIGRRFRK